jgi:hypothetical protein
MRRVARLAEREQYQREMWRANEVMERTRREDPAAWDDYLSELRTFEAGTMADGLGQAAAEWPECNDVADIKPGAGHAAATGQSSSRQSGRPPSIGRAR